MVPLRQANCPGLHRSSVGANTGALSTRPGRSQGSGGTQGRGREWEQSPGAGAQAGRCSDLQARATGHDLRLMEEQRGGSQKRLEATGRTAWLGRHLPFACLGSPQGRPGAGWPLRSDPKLGI